MPEFYITDYGVTLGKKSERLVVKEKNQVVMEVPFRDYGLTHIQYSAFFGELNHNRRQEPFGRLKRVPGQKEGKIIIVPVCDKDLRLLLEICYPEEVSPGIAKIAESARSYLIR